MMARFGFHHDPAIDFCCEVDAIEGLAFDLKAGHGNAEVLSDRVFKAMAFRVGGDFLAVKAKQRLREIESTLDADAFRVRELLSAGIPAIAAPLLAAKDRWQALAIQAGRAVAAAVRVAGEAADEWDAAPEGMKAGKLLIALAGRLQGFRPDIDAIHEYATAKPPPSFQGRVGDWMAACFGPEISADKVERNHRFIEEALELVQACGCTKSEAHQLVDYVFDRPQGDVNQEVGGVMVTLAALCLANGFDMHGAGETELARVWTKIEKIRAKQAAKPRHSPLPEQPAAPTDEVRRLRIEAAARAICKARDLDPDTLMQVFIGDEIYPTDETGHNSKGEPVKFFRAWRKYTLAATLALDAADRAALAPVQEGK